MSWTKDFIPSLFKTRAHRKLLIAFCNLSAPRDSGVLLYDVDSGKTQWVNMGFSKLISSCTGLWVDDKFIFSLFQAEGISNISVINKGSLKPVFCQTLEEVKDGHSICVLGNKLYVVSTGSDEVLRYEFTGKKVLKPEVFWKASDEKKDTHHLNSIIPFKKEIYVSGFGSKEGELWDTAIHGYIINISANKCVKKGIYHPHTLAVLDDKVFYCESSTQTFYSIDETIKFSLDGYTRGICFIDNKTVAIGTSIGRKSSKSTGIVHNPADPGVKAGTCAITFFNIESGSSWKRDLSQYSSEIYDISIFGEKQK